MRTIYKRLLALLLCCLTLTVLLLPAAAEEGAYVDFTRSVDGARISGDGKDYYCYDMPRAMFLMSPEIFYYEDTIQMWEDTCEIRAAHRGAEVIFVHIDTSNYYVYASDAGKTYLDAFLLSHEHIMEYAIYDDNGRYATVPERFVREMSGLGKLSSSQVQSKAVSGATLENCEYADLGAMDNTNSYFARYGLIFTLSDGYYYLDRACYDEVLSFADIYNATKPFVLYRLPDELADEYTEARRGARRYKIDYTFEVEGQEPVSSGEYLAVAKVAALILAGFFGILLPGAVLAISLCVALRGERKKQWLLLSALCGVWVLIGVLLLILLLCL